MTSRTPESPDADGGDDQRDDEISLNIVGHEDRDPPRGADAAGLFGDGEAPDGDGADGDGATGNGTDGAIDAPPTVTAADHADEEVEPVELLVQLAENDEIEAWDIDIVAVTDKFLDRLDASDLRTSGRALFYASVLLRMKSDELLAPDEAEEPEPELWEPSDEEFDGFDPVEALEEEMDRRLDRRHARGSPETLEELVHELREAERGTWWKESRTYDTSDSPSGFRRGTQTLDYHSGDDMRLEDEPTEADVTNTAHGEHIEDVIDDVRAMLQEQYDTGRTEVLYAEIREAGGSPMMTFLAVLFLANRGFVGLEQDELFADLWIRDAGADVEASEGEEPEAVAD